MNMMKEVTPAQAYLNGMLYAAFCVKVISCDAVEWQIDAVKECAKELKEKEIEHSSLTPIEKDNQKRLWKQWIDEAIKDNSLAKYPNEIRPNSRTKLGQMPEQNSAKRVNKNRPNDGF